MNDSNDDGVVYETDEGDGRTKRKRAGGWRFLLWVSVFAFFILMVIAAGSAFSGTTVLVTRKSVPVSLNHEFTGSAAASASVRLESAAISESNETAVSATQSRKVSEKASGTIIVYNAFSNSSQRLIKNTRFEAPNGLIYRISRSLEVPGKKTVNGTTVPGSIEVEVSADSPGDEYNIPPADFTIPGFKNDAARFAGFYARGKTPMTGGVDDVVLVPAETDEEKARSNLRSELQERILEKARAGVPSGFVFFDPAIRVRTESLPYEGKGKNSGVVRERMDATVFYINENDLARAISEKLVPTYKGLAVKVPNLTSLEFVPKFPPEVGNVETPGELTFSIRGNTFVVGLFDEERLRGVLVGKPRSDLAAALSAFPTIEKVEVVVRPFWNRRFPENPKKIEIENSPLESDVKGSR